MARTTWLGAVNQVLVRLRRDQVASVSASTYSNLIGALVNEAKREVEDSWAWTELRTELQLSTTTTSRTYRLTGFGDRYRIHEVWNDTLNGRVLPAADVDFERWEYTTSLPAGAPSYWRINGLQGGDPVLELERLPDAVYALRVIATLPQADLASNATEISVPHWPVVLGAYARALSERGEDGGVLYDEAQREYQGALSDAIAQGNANAVRGMGSDWVIE